MCWVLEHVDKGIIGNGRPGREMIVEIVSVWPPSSWNSSGLSNRRTKKLQSGKQEKQN